MDGGIVAFMCSPRKPLHSNLRNRKVPYFEHPFIVLLKEWVLTPSVARRGGIAPRHYGSWPQPFLTL